MKLSNEAYERIAEEQIAEAMAKHAAEEHARHRDMFAASALPALITAYGLEEPDSNGVWLPIQLDSMCRAAYRIADAMIAASEEPSE